MTRGVKFNVLLLQDCTQGHDSLPNFRGQKSYKSKNSTRLIIYI